MICPHLSYGGGYSRGNYTQMPSWEAQGLGVRPGGGAAHCPKVGCLMEDARGKVATCDREHDICPACRAKLVRWKREIPKAPQIPWPRPR